MEHAHPSSSCSKAIFHFNVKNCAKLKHLKRQMFKDLRQALLNIKHFSSAVTTKKYITVFYCQLEKKLINTFEKLSSVLCKFNKSDFP